MGTAIIVGIILLLGTVWYCTKPNPEENFVYNHTEKETWDWDENEMYELVNDFRAKYKLNRLVQDDMCYYIAKYRAEEIMQEYRNSGEITHNLEAVTIMIMENGGITGRENLGVSWYSVKTCYDAWITSDSHLNNILGDWKYTGIVIDKNGAGRPFYVQVFAK